MRDKIENLTSNQKRICNLDLLRIMACIAVVGLHTLQKDLSIINSSLYYLCGFAVPVFFMASGYVLFQRESVNWGYTARKIKSILVLVILWNVIFAILKIALALLCNQMDVVLLIDIAKDFPRGFLQRGPFWHFWYFGALIILYALLPILHKMCHSNKAIGRIWVILALVCVGIQCFSYFMHQPMQKHVRQMFRLWTWVQYFVLGGVIFRYKDAILRKLKYIGPSLILVSVLVILEQNIAGRKVIHNQYAEYFYDDAITILWCGLIFLWGMSITLSDRQAKIVEKFAPLTLGVYIIHPFIRKFVEHYIEIDSLLLSLLYFIGMLIVSFGATYLMKRVKLSALVELKR